MAGAGTALLNPGVSWDPVTRYSGAWEAGPDSSSLTAAWGDSGVTRACAGQCSPGICYRCYSRHIAGLAGDTVCPVPQLTSLEEAWGHRALQSLDFSSMVGG